jgi:hypothetical protein
MLKSVHNFTNVLSLRHQSWDTFHTSGPLQ